MWAVAEQPAPPSDPRIQPIGQVEPLCPYCHKDVKKVFGWRNCPHCGGSIHAGRRPFDNCYVMLTDAEALACDEQWAIAKGRHEQWLSERLRYEAEESRLRESLRRLPTDREVKYSLFDHEKAEFALACQWGLWRSAVYGQAELAWHAKDWWGVIDLQGQVAYVDAAGGCNCTDKPFDRSQAFIAPGCASRIAEAGMALGIRLEEIEAHFLTAAGAARQLTGARLDTLTAWRKVRAEIRKQYRQWAITGRANAWWA